MQPNPFGLTTPLTMPSAYGQPSTTPWLSASQHHGSAERDTEVEYTSTCLHLLHRQLDLQAELDEGAKVLGLENDMAVQGTKAMAAKSLNKDGAPALSHWRLRSPNSKAG